MGTRHIRVRATFNILSVSVQFYPIIDSFIAAKVPLFCRFSAASLPLVNAADMRRKCGTFAALCDTQVLVMRHLSAYTRCFCHIPTLRRWHRTCARSSRFDERSDGQPERLVHKGRLQGAGGRDGGCDLRVRRRGVAGELQVRGNAVVEFRNAGKAVGDNDDEQQAVGARVKVVAVCARKAFMI